MRGTHVRALASQLMAYAAGAGVRDAAADGADADAIGFATSSCRRIAGAPDAVRRPKLHVTAASREPTRLAHASRSTPGVARAVVVYSVKPAGTRAVAAVSEDEDAASSSALPSCMHASSVAGCISRPRDRVVSG